MITVNQVYEAMQAIAPLELAEHWDNPGLLVDCGGQMHRVLAALDITPEVVAEAAAKQCEMIVSHHPVIFDPLKKIGPQDVPFQLVQAGISAICMHTNLSTSVSAVSNCNNYKASKSVVPFAGSGALFASGRENCRTSAKETIFGNAHRFILFLTHFRAKMMQIFPGTPAEKERFL